MEKSVVYKCILKNNGRDCMHIFNTHLGKLYIIVVVVSFPKGRNESCQSLRLAGHLHDRWRHRLSLPPQFRHGAGGGEIYIFSSTPALVVSAATTHKTFGPTDLTSTYSVCIRWHRTQALPSGVRCSNH
ncbi:hypothetical protein TNCV_818221 [Trichonephila clavipes]|nr:hypothetical protein TNCV_818221 [Trichonephila clavipes]